MLVKVILKCPDSLRDAIERAAEDEVGGNGTDDAFGVHSLKDKAVDFYSTDKGSSPFGLLFEVHLESWFVRAKSFVYKLLRGKK